MREKVFSIEPYCDVGIMGAELSVNKHLTSRYLETADIRHNVVVTREVQKERRNVETLGETMALKKVAFSNNNVISTSETYKLRMHRDSRSRTLEIAIDDAKLAEITDEKLRKDYVKNPNLNGHDAFKNTYVENLNQSVKEGLKETLFDYKVNVKKHYSGYLMMSPVFFLPINIWEDNVDGAALNLGIYTVCAAMYNGLSYILREMGDDDLNMRYEKNILLPPVPIDSYIRGRIYLARHGGKFIQRENEQAVPREGLEPSRP